MQTKSTLQTIITLKRGWKSTTLLGALALAPILTTITTAPAQAADKKDRPARSDNNRDDKRKDNSDNKGWNRDWDNKRDDNKRPDNNRPTTPGRPDWNNRPGTPRPDNDHDWDNHPGTPRPGDNRPDWNNRPGNNRPGDNNWNNHPGRPGWSNTPGRPDWNNRPGSPRPDWNDHDHDHDWDNHNGNDHDHDWNNNHNNPWDNRPPYNGGYYPGDGGYRPGNGGYYPGNGGYYPGGRNGDDYHNSHTVTGYVTEDLQGDRFRFRSGNSTYTVVVRGGEPRDLSRGDEVRIYGYEDNGLFYASGIRVLNNH